jgi:hypothetical protein
MHSTYWGLSSVLRKALFHTVIIQIAGTVEMGHFAHLRVTTYKIHILPYKNHIQTVKIRNYPGSWPNKPVVLIYERVLKKKKKERYE